MQLKRTNWALKSLLVLLLVAVTTMTYAQQKPTYQVAKRNSRALLLKHNNPGLEVDLGVGLWGIPIPTDYDGDGRKDLLVSCPDRPYKGLYLFQNIGTSAEPFFAPAKKLHAKGPNNIRLSEVDGKQYVLAKTVGKLFASTRNWGYNDRNILIHGRRRFYTEPRFELNGKFLEPVWHRATLDLMAALALTGEHRFAGTVVSFRAGHTLDCDAVRALYRNDLLVRI